MSTPSLEAGSAQAISAETTPAQAGGAAGSKRDVAMGALIAEAGAFVDTFGRWAGRRAAEAGASVPRLRLLYSVHCHGPQKMADLADELAVTPRNVTALVDGLESEGLVRRVPHSTDRRITLVELTGGADRVAGQFAEYQTAITDLFSGLSEADRGTLIRLLSALNDRMRTDPACRAARQNSND
jgi:DNA-binding MarR family transcriptional regulator